MKFNIYTLGCKVNTYESNVMKDALCNAGYLEVSHQEPADIIIINTCTVTNQADHKSMKTIRHARMQNPNAILVVCGCFSQNAEKDIKEADIVIGNEGKSRIVSYIQRYLENEKKIIEYKDLTHTTFESMQLNNFDQTRAFIKIQDGCNNFCTYCIIPYTRGNVRSKKREDVLAEATHLVKQGHREIVLTGIHTGNYGAEFEQYDFAALLEDLVQIKDLARIRVSSIEITELNERVLQVLKEHSSLVDHFHIPLQSGSNSVLTRMNRKYEVSYFVNKVNQIRTIRPNISITTDVIVGFPGETEEEFEETIRTIEQIGFSKLHVFPYSKRDGTAAARFEHQIDDVTKKKRVHRLLELSKKLEENYMERFVGRVVDVLLEVQKDENMIGHTGNYLLVKVPTNTTNFCKVKINKIEYPYCVGEAISVDCFQEI